ncbi:MAG: carboxypeptidase regulatory-like domain-containing protein [Nitrospirae bacterium]|nr:carboxypeptidase regulatory-like domain-containing protein [Nitrospirota bacterium]
MKVFMYGLAGILLWMAWLAPDAVKGSEYRDIPVVLGGNLTGKVTLKGPVPDSRAFPLILYPFGNFCKKISDGKGNVVVNEFIVGPEKGLQDTVIAIQDVKAGKPFQKINAEFMAVDCMFHPANVPDNEQYEITNGKLSHVHPAVDVIRNNQTISVVNKDPIIHNGQVFQSERGDIVLNFPIPISDKANGGIIHLEPGKRIAQMICGMHEFMQTWGYLVDNPYYDRTKKSGLFRIDQIPAGRYKVTAWHPHFKQVEKEITIASNETVTLDFEFDSSDIRHSNYEIQEKFRIGPEAHHHENLRDCSPPYCSGPESGK